ncbi:MAG: hypothetical protein Q8P84_08160 [Deltaproteobacteria bacterium]|nr:hypothetical protein [Deltaproteobacteria bacterium]
MQEESRTVWDAFQITERDGSKAQWNKVGVAFQNRDQSINVFLEAFPKDGKLQLRDRKFAKKNNYNNKEESL